MDTAVFDALQRSAIVREYTAAFCEATGLALRLVPAAPDGVNSLGGRQHNPFCSMMWETPPAAAACRALQGRLQQCLTDKLAPQSQECFAGMTEVAVPVVVGAEHVATLLAGQVFSQRPQAQDFERVARQLESWGLNMDRSQLESAYFQTRTVAQEQLRALISLLMVFAQHLADVAHRLILAGHSGEPLAVTRAKEFVHAHLAGPITLSELAGHVHLSRYYFCKLFKKATGLTFGNYVARARTEKARELLLNRHMSIEQVAHACGFCSAAHFSRVFKKCVGMTPGSYRATQSI